VNLATLVSSAVCLLGLLFAGITWFIASAPGLRGLRYFSATCLWSALYAATNAMLASPSLRLARFGMHFAILFIGLQGVTWYVYTARRDGRTLRTVERVLSAGVILGGLIGLVPHALVKDEVWVHQVPALGITYLDARTTPLGDAVAGFCLVNALILVWRSLRRFKKSGRSERAEALGLVALLATGLNDSLASAGTIPMPYLLDIGFLVLVLLTGSALGVRFIQNAQKLESAQHGMIEKERLAAVGEMSAVVAHEVRSPTAVIFNAAALLRKNPQESDKLLSIIEEEAGRLKRLVDDFLEFARPVEARLARSDVRPMLESIADGVSVGSGEEVEVYVDTTLPEIEIDPRLVRQALLNLVTNAIQSERRAHPVCVTAKRLGAHWMRISVKDDGAGVPPELAERIYLPFFTTRSSGTGLGLPFVQRIARAHGGEITHEATPGGGATFNLDLPSNKAARDGGWPPME
jgi:signal transduction histidine kinase